MATSRTEPDLSCCDIERSVAVEDYLKNIYLLSFHHTPVTTSRIASRLGVATASVSAMLRRLTEAELLVRSGGRGHVLTEHGEAHALHVVRRHRLLETYLGQQLGMSWDEVHDEAEMLEHALSDRLTDRIDEALGHPSRDPHGDPIPPSAGDHVEDWTGRLQDAPHGARFRVERVLDEDSDALRYLADLGIRPGVTLEVGERAPFGGPLWVTIEDRQHALGAPLTGIVHGVVL